VHLDGRAKTGFSLCGKGSFYQAQAHFSRWCIPKIPVSEPNGYFSFSGAEILLAMRAEAR